MTSTAQRTNEKLKDQGCKSAIVEKWNAFAGPPVEKKVGTCSCGRDVYESKPCGIRQDLWGIADVIAIEPGKQGSLLVQTCAGHGAVAKHLTKVLASDALVPWLEAGNRFVIWSWAKRMVEKRERWTCVEHAVTLQQAKEARSCPKHSAASDSATCATSATTTRPYKSATQKTYAKSSRTPSRARSGSSDKEPDLFPDLPTKHPKESRREIPASDLPF